MIAEQLQHKQTKLAVIGLGYVGLPVAIHFSKKIPVIGFDINDKRVQLLKQKADPNKEISGEVSILFIRVSTAAINLEPRPKLCFSYHNADSTNSFSARG